MKILVVSQNYYPDNFRINDITAELVKKGHKVTVLTGLPDYTTGKIPEEYHFFQEKKRNYSRRSNLPSANHSEEKRRCFQRSELLFFCIYGLCFLSVS